MAKTYGGWGAFGSPEFDGSSISGGKPVPSNSKAENYVASKAQKKSNKVINCRKCKPERGKYCGPAHSKIALGG